MIMTSPPNESNNAPVEVSSVADFTKWVDKRGGRNMLFRGLANAEWSVESSLYRRLKYNKVQDRDIDHSVFMEMVRMLISRSRRNGYHVEHGRSLEDLTLLANLQHNGAATCLIDFTENPLVALYFACAAIDSKNAKNANGKVFAFNSNNAKLYAAISMNDFGKEIEYWFKEYEQNKKLWVLSPQKLSKRIIAQQSVFVFGSPTIPTKNFDTCEIKNKKAIMEELKTYGISEEKLFDDFAGFSIQNSANKEYESWDTDSYFMSGILYAISGNYKSAIECYDNDLVSDPGRSATYNNRGNSKDNLGDFKGAISDYDRAIKLKPKDPAAYDNRGIAKNNLGDFKGAISDFDEAIRLDPQYAFAYNNRGAAKDNLGDFKDAISDYDEAIKLNPKDALAYYNLGVANMGLKKIEVAKVNFAKAKELNPELNIPDLPPDTPDK